MIRIIEFLKSLVCCKKIPDDKILDKIILDALNKWIEQEIADSPEFLIYKKKGEL